MSTYQCSVCDLNLDMKSLKNSKRIKLFGLSFFTLEKSVPFALGNFQKLTPGF